MNRPRLRMSRFAGAGTKARSAPGVALAIGLIGTVAWTGSACHFAFFPAPRALGAAPVRDGLSPGPGRGSVDPVVSAAPEPREVAPSTPSPSPSPPEIRIVAPPSFRRGSPPPVPPPLPLPATGRREGGVWAVVIGIDDYPGNEYDLRAAAADARTVDATLAAHGVETARRVLLTDAQASARNIQAALDWLVAHAGDATAVLFYAGHVRQVGGDRDTDGEAIDEAFVAADSEEILDGELARRLRHLQARSVWLAIAGCHRAGFDDATGPGRLLTAAAAEDKPAYENSALGHSYLVEYMVRRGLLEGRAAGSLQEAFAWARGEIARDYPARLPVIIDQAVGRCSCARRRPPGTKTRATRPAPRLLLQTSSSRPVRRRLPRPRLVPSPIPPARACPRSPCAQWTRRGPVGDPAASTRAADHA